MGIFDPSQRNPADKPQQPSAISLEQTSYDIAYFILPQYVFQSLDRIVELCTQSPKVAGPFYYFMACRAREITPDIESPKHYKWQSGELGARKYLALEYPAPTPVDMDDSDLITMLQSGHVMVLAPYFSVILYGDDSAPDYFILGQAPIGGGTTMRKITAEGVNCNLGPGPAPKLDLFLADIILNRQSGNAK